MDAKRSVLTVLMTVWTLLSNLAAAAEPSSFDRSAMLVASAPMEANSRPLSATAFVVRTDSVPPAFYLVLSDREESFADTAKIGLPVASSETVWANLRDVVEPIDGRYLHSHPSEPLAAARLRLGVGAEPFRGLKAMAFRMNELREPSALGSEVQVVGFPSLLNVRYGDHAVRAAFTSYVATEEVSAAGLLPMSSVVFLHPAISFGVDGSPVVYAPVAKGEPMRCIGMCHQAVGDDRITGVFTTVIPARVVRSFIEAVDRKSSDRGEAAGEVPKGPPPGGNR